MTEKEKRIITEEIKQGIEDNGKSYEALYESYLLYNIVLKQESSVIIYVLNSKTFIQTRG